jgi:hypothetical protein
MKNIDPKLWASSAWSFLYYIILSYSINPTEQEKNDIKNFLNSYGDVIPCLKCRTNFKDHFHKNPLNYNALSSRLKLMNWLLNLYNEINISIGKKKISMCVFKNMYEHKSNSLYFNKKIMIVINALLFASLLALLYIIFKK